MLVAYKTSVMWVWNPEADPPWLSGQFLWLMATILKHELVFIYNHGSQKFEKSNNHVWNLQFFTVSFMKSLGASGLLRNDLNQEFFESDFLGFFTRPKSWYWRFSTSDIFYPESMVITKIKHLSNTVQDLILRQVTLEYLLGFSVGYLVFHSWVCGIWSCMDLAATYFFPCLIFSSYPSPLPNVTKH